ncbi:hypothetical protein FACS1894176_03510 [Bacteroidia bacterium]|nr:hypothetical protein FACS1894176_03510 [Bacteroidia bacterium]
MKKYLQILGFAFKEQLEYRRNFFFGITTMAINDAIFLVIFAIFLSYFSGTGLTFGNFLLIHSMMAFQYALVNGVFSNIGSVSEIIEEGKMDYYLSFPTSPLGFLAITKVKVHNLGDLFFAVISMIIYVVAFCTGNPRIFIAEWLGVMLLSGLFVLGLFLLVGSASFRLQRGSKVRDLFQSFFLVVGSYPPDIYQRDKLLFVLISVVGLYPGVFLPYRILVEGSTLFNWVILALISFAILLIGVLVFYRGLKKYSSGNLVLQM